MQLPVTHPMSPMEMSHVGVATGLYHVNARIVVFSQNYPVVVVPLLQ